MEKNHKHMCKFCYKEFPCGRSLGGHMRSHLITINSSSDQKLPKKKLPPLTNHRFASKSEELDQEKPCKECGKTFHSSKALFGHMKSHSVLGKATTTSLEDEDSWNTCSSEGTIRRKRSERTKRYTNTNTTNSSSLTDSDIDHQEQEEVALSLILLSSMEKGSLGNLSSVVESCGTGFDSLEAKKTSKRKIECNEVNSPKTTINNDHFGSNFAKNDKFKCVICRKSFPSYQALGGHRASHKKFKGSCAPSTHLEPETTNQTEKLVGPKKHECPICFKVFGSGQALGGHKRSHLMNDQPKTVDDPSATSDRPIIDPSVQQVRGYIDLNLPAPVEEECDGFGPWWIGASHQHQHEPILGLL